MKKPLPFILIIMTTIILSFPSYCQEGRGSGRVFGYVFDEEGQPISGVKVVMESSVYDFKRETTSDRNGKWVLMGFGKDVYRFTFSKTGYKTVLSQVSLSGINRNPEQRIVMERYSLQQSSQVIPLEDKSKLDKAVQLSEEGEYTEALELYKEFVDAYPDVYQARYNLASTYLKLKQYDAAIIELKKVLEALLEQGDDAEARKKSGEVHVLIAEAYMDQKNHEEAAVHYTKAMEINPPTDAAIAFNVAEIMFTANKVDEAIKYYQLASRLKPDNGIYYLKLGYAYLNKSDIPSAIKNFEKFLELSPEDPKAESIKNLIRSLRRKNP
ncbi:MAG: tetratricopeptide repeat protein [Candidatus Aenigmarchaeota archaeon]|nr:tetratricopeptide repeat protein [Candidatus Aenigmarchaeota archaeon]